MRTSRYYENLIQTVIDNSDAHDWSSAVQEWSVYDVEEDEELVESCVCGKENLRYLFTIKNDINGNILYPIGSSCIKKFERKELNEEVDVKIQLFKLLHAIEENEYLTFSAEFFSRKLLRYLFENNAFKATAYNNYDPENDYEFMLKMFNARQRTQRQEKKAIAILLSSIKPFLKEQLNLR
ncbi:hypothetical protein M2140_001618 [Clostridiales Family XIII bacterium PM5-7]